MKHTIKLLLFNILLCVAPALQAMGIVRSFGARAFKAASASAAKFKMNTFEKAGKAAFGFSLAGGIYQYSQLVAQDKAYKADINNSPQAQIDQIFQSDEHALQTTQSGSHKLLNVEAIERVYSRAIEEDAYYVPYLMGFMFNLRFNIAQMRKRAETEKAIKAALSEAYAQEIQEIKQGNIIFYHGQEWKFHFYADVYKLLWNITQKHKKMPKDYIPLRFTEQTKRGDELWMNYALFGNTGWKGSSSFLYFMKGVNQKNCNVDQIFKGSSVGNYFAKYAKEISELELKHQNATINGNLLLISMTPEQAKKWVVAEYPLWRLEGQEITMTRRLPFGFTYKSIASDAAEIIQGAKNKITQQTPYTNGETDGLVFRLQVTPEVLDPMSGIRMYSFNTADKEKLKKYTEARDALFAKIKQDFEQDQAAGKA